MTDRLDEIKHRYIPLNSVTEVMNGRALNDIRWLIEQLEEARLGGFRQRVLDLLEREANR